MQRPGPLPRRTPLKARSHKQARLYRTQRAPLVAALLLERPICERCQAARSVDVHEIQTRARGGSITDETNLACLCRPCHDWITREPAKAQHEGWLRHSWD